VWMPDNPNRKGRFPDSWKPDNAGVTTEARPKGAPPTREAMERDGAWLGTQTFIRDGKVDEKKVPRGALNLPADPNAQSGVTVDSDLPAAGGNKGFGYDVDPVFGKMTGAKMTEVPDFIPGLPGFNPTLPGGGWGGGAWILPKEKRPKFKRVEPELIEKNKDVRVTAWENSTLETSIGWAGILSKNQKPYKSKPQAVTVTKAPRKDASAARVPVRGTLRKEGVKQRGKKEGKATDAITASLPAGWSETVDNATGDKYYYNESGETTWDLPSE